MLATLTVVAEAATCCASLLSIAGLVKCRSAQFPVQTRFGCETVGCLLQTRRVSPNQWKLGGEIKNEAIGLVTGKCTNFRVVLDDQIKV